MLNITLLCMSLVNINLSHMSTTNTMHFYCMYACFISFKNISSWPYLLDFQYIYIIQMVLLLTSDNLFHSAFQYITYRSVKSFKKMYWCWKSNFTGDYHLLMVLNDLHENQYSLKVDYNKFFCEGSKCTPSFYVFGLQVIPGKSLVPILTRNGHKILSPAQFIGRKTQMHAGIFFTCQ